LSETALIEFLTALPLHGILLIGIVVLWRDNQKLREKLEQVRQTSAGNTALLLGQNAEIDSIKAHITGNTPPGGSQLFEAMPPYRKATAKDFETGQ